MSIQAAFVKYDHVIQALAANGPDQALNIGVRMSLLASAQMCRCMHKAPGARDFAGNYLERMPLVHAHNAANTGLPSCVGSAQSGERPRRKR